MLQSFRFISVIEGLSLMALLFIAMPAKYYFDTPALMPYVGMTHGLLWMLYVITSLNVSHHQKWSVFYWLGVLVLSVLPCGFLLLEWLLRKPLRAEENVT